jgi:hypothetical protein
MDEAQALSPDAVAHLETTKRLLGERGIVPDTPSGQFSQEVLDREITRRQWEAEIRRRETDFMAIITRMTAQANQRASWTALGPSPDLALAHALALAMTNDEERDQW